MENETLHNYQTHIKGEISEDEVRNALKKKGCYTCKADSNHYKYDFIFEYGKDYEEKYGEKPPEGRFFAVQVKTGIYKGKHILVNTVAITRKRNELFNTSTLYTKEDIDYFGVYCFELDTCYLIPINLVTKQKTLIHLTPSLKIMKNYIYSEDCRIKLEQN